MKTGGSLSRRDFHRLASAALGGLMAGAVSGCTTDQKGGGATAANQGSGGDQGARDKHVCRGLNDCKTTGNACAGQGSCATLKAHGCSSQNDCRGQGGCGEKPGENDCKGHGGCAVPLADHAWKTARENFEKRMKAAGKKFGPAPAKKSEK